MKIGELLFWALFLLSIAVVVWLVLGSTPTLEQALLLIILAMTIKNSIITAGNKIEIKNMKLHLHRRIQVIEEKLK